MRKLQYLLFSLCILCSELVWAQTMSEDSLLQSLENSISEKKAKIYINLFESTYRSDLNKSWAYLQKAFELEGENPDSSTRAMILYDYGIYYTYTGEYDKSEDYYKQAQTLYIALKDSMRLAECYNSFGLVYDDKGEFVKALDMYITAYLLANKLNYTSCYVNATNNIGLIYAQQGEFQNALSYFKKSLKGQTELGNYKGIGNTSNNLGMIYHMMGNQDSSMYFFDQALAVWIKNNDQRGMAMTYNNLASYYGQKGDVSKVREYLNKSLEICYTIKDEYGITQNFQQLYAHYIQQGNRDSAYYMANKLVERSTDLGLKPSIKFAYEKLAAMHEEDANYKKALENYKLFTQVKDSIFNESKSKELGKLEARYDFEKKQEMEIRQQKEEQLRIAEETNRRNNIQYSIIFLAILVVFGLVMSLGFLKVSSMMAEGLIFFSFLILFEFILVIADPYIDTFSDGAPGWKLLINAFIAAGIFPLHAFFERKIKRRILRRE